MKNLLAIGAGLAGALTVLVSDTEPANAQASAPEWEVASSTQFYAVSTKALTNRVLEKASVAELQRAAEQGDAEAAWILSYAYKRGMGGLAENPDKAYQWSRRSCDLGSVRGCNALAYNLVSAVGTQRDRAGAMQLFERTCEQGVASSCGEAAFNYYNGNAPIKKDLERALGYWIKACDLGSATSCRSAGFMFSKGYGAPENAGRAQTYYARGCDGDEPQSCFYAGRLLQRATRRAEETPSIVRQIFTFYERGCELGQKEACFNRGTIENEGRHGRPRSTLAAVPWMEKACELKMDDACYNLGSWLINGRAGRKDGERAIALLGPLCLREKKPDIQACNNAGTAAYRGVGMSAPDYDSARTFYTKACYEGRLTASCRTLSDMYTDQQITAKTPGEAEWLAGQLCFKSDELEYCQTGTVQHAILKAASEENYSSAAKDAGALCVNGDTLACKYKPLLNECARAKGNPQAQDWALTMLKCSNEFN